MRFSRELPEDSPYQPRDVLRDRDARELLAMPQEEFSVAFRKSPMKRAKLRGLKRNSAVVLGDVGTADDVEALTRALDVDEPLVREHARRALERRTGRDAGVTDPRRPSAAPVARHPGYGSARSDAS